MCLRRADGASMRLPRMEEIARCVDVSEIGNPSLSSSQSRDLFCGPQREAQQAVTLPAGWQQMSPTDFAALIRSLQEQFKALSQTDQNAVAAHGKQLFLQVNVLSTSLNYQTLEMLHWVCRFSLPAHSDRSDTQGSPCVGKTTGPVSRMPKSGQRS